MTTDPYSNPVSETGGFPLFLNGSVVFVELATIEVDTDSYFLDSLFSSGSVTVGSVNPLNALVLPGPLGALSLGTIESVSTDWHGTFDDFTLFSVKTLSGSVTNPIGVSFSVSPSTYDPYFAPLLSGKYVSTRSVGSWTNNGLTIIPPRSAKFMALGVSINSTSNPSNNYFSALMDAASIAVVSSVASVTGPVANYPDFDPYVYPRALVTKVLPDRANLCGIPRMTVQNSSSAFIVSSGYASTGGMTGNFAADPSVTWNTYPTLKVTPSSTAGSISDALVNSVVPGTSLTFSMLFRSTSRLSGTYTPTISFTDQHGATISTVTGNQTISGLTNGAWTSVSLTTTVPTGAVRATLTPISTVTAAAGDTFWVTAALLEKTPLVLPWFDGSSGSDYIWHNQGSLVNCGQSLFYTDLNRRLGILNSELIKNVPAGMRVLEPTFAPD